LAAVEVGVGGGEVHQEPHRHAPALPGIQHCVQILGLKSIHRRQNPLRPRPESRFYFSSKCHRPLLLLPRGQPFIQIIRLRQHTRLHHRRKAGGIEGGVRGNVEG